ncbi:hypothetical protein [Pseudonocardia sp. GCM10023141]|uniref:hypothetical protein n=1 Tax=Pseudonocardia sp. GCM10023141 TaxID=3252653 RepID=UPI0036120465
MKVQINSVTHNVETIVELLTHLGRDELNALNKSFGFEDDDIEFYVAKDQRLSSPGALLADVQAVLRILYWEKTYGGLPNRQSDRAMVHFLFPDAHVGGGPDSSVFQQAKEAIGAAQSMRLAGPGMLDLYATYVEFMLDHVDEVEKFMRHPVEIGDVARRRSLAAGSSRGSGVTAHSFKNDLAGLEVGQSLIMSFNYGTHQTYAAISGSGQHLHLDYFDRQRQSLILRGKTIPGYLDGAHAMNGQPLRFTFDLDTAELVSLYQAAESVAAGRDEEGGLCNGRRAAVLKRLADAAVDVELFGEVEPAQHADAINCAWASLESVVRTAVGVQVLASELDFIRKIVVNRYVAPLGTAEERAAAGVPTAV